MAAEQRPCQGLRSGELISNVAHGLGLEARKVLEALERGELTLDQATKKIYNLHDRRDEAFQELRRREFEA